MLQLDQAGLHGSLTDPVLDSLSFLNEVMGRFPEAVSFAPGAPHLAHLKDFDVSRYVETYVDFLCRDRGITDSRARRLLYEYGPSRGLINDLIAGALRADYGIDVPARSVVVTVGAQEAMLLALRALHRSPADLLAVASPCFVGITGAARLLDVGVVGIAETDDGPDLDQLGTACAVARRQGRRIRALYVAPDFANPSGSLLSLPARLRLHELAEREDFLLLEDNAYGFTAAPGGELPTLKALDTTGRVVHLGTFAKVCLPGARVGFVVADQVVRPRTGAPVLLADELARLKTMVTVNTSPVCQAVIGGMLLEHGGSLRALGAAKAGRYRRNLAQLLDALDRHLGGGDPGSEVSWNRPAGGFFVRLRAPVPLDADLLELSASRFGVLWTPMAQFHLDGGGRHEMRLSCSYLDPEQIENGVGRLAAFLGYVSDRSGQRSNVGAPTRRA